MDNIKVYNSFEDLRENYAGEKEFMCEGEIFHLHHRSQKKGYQSIKYNSLENYKGRFGEGIVIKTHLHNSTRCHTHSYFILVK